VCSMFVTLLILAHDRPRRMFFWSLAMITGLLISLIIFVWILGFFGISIVKKFKIKSHKLVRFIKDFNFSGNRISNQIILMQLLGYSAAMWIAMYSFYYFIIHSLGFNIPALDILFLYVTLFYVRLLPIRGLGNFGTYEDTVLECF